MATNGNNRLYGEDSNIIEAAILAGWEPSEQSRQVWDSMLEEASDFLINISEQGSN